MKLTKEWGRFFVAFGCATLIALLIDTSADGNWLGVVIGLIGAVSVVYGVVEAGLWMRFHLRRPRMALIECFQCRTPIEGRDYIWQDSRGNQFHYCSKACRDLAGAK